MCTSRSALPKFNCFVHCVWQTSHSTSCVLVMQELRNEEINQALGIEVSKDEDDDDEGAAGIPWLTDRLASCVAKRSISNSVFGGKKPI